MCPYAHHPHPNVLPAMPDRKKSSKRTESEGAEKGKDASAEEKVPTVNGSCKTDELTESGEKLSPVLKPQEFSAVPVGVSSS